MRTKFDTAGTREEIPHQMEKLVAWSKHKIPREQPASKLGTVSAADIDSMITSDEAKPGMKAILGQVGNGKPMVAAKLIGALTKAVDDEVVRVAGPAGSEDAKTLDIKELRQISEPLRPLALIALAYANDDEFGTFADTSQAFDRVYAAAMGKEYPVLSEENLSIVNGWLAHHNPETTEVTIPAEWKVKQKDVPKGPLSKELYALRSEYSGSYKVTPFRDPSNGTYVIYAASTNGPNEEGFVVFDKTGKKKIAEIKLGDDGTVSSYPDFPEQPAQS
jgi:hypothetical protein